MKFKTADRLEKIQHYYFLKKLEQVAAMRDRGLDVVNLGIGSPDLTPPPAAVETATATLRNAKAHGYPSYRSSPELRSAISDWYQAWYGVKPDPAREVLPLLGSKEGILYLSLALLNPGDTVLIPNPGYPAYTSIAAMIGAQIIYYDLTEANDWLPDLDAIASMDLSRCKLMWVNYPHMPTGKVVDLDFFGDLVALGRRHGLVICNDNPYGLVLNDQPPVTLLKADPRQETACELNSLSKSCNMAGWRVGMLLGPGELLDAVLCVKSNVDSGMFLAVQQGAIAALQAGPDWHQARNAVYARRRELVWQLFDALGFSYRRDRAGLFVWAKAPDAIPDVPAYLDQLLDQIHLFLTPGLIFGSNGARYARASLCADEAVIRQALERVRGFQP